ncbi:MAG: glycosyltransferase [Tatlockia sp.]|nr:glycosyltransferase [Tatlockia sp.]
MKLVLFTPVIKSSAIGRMACLVVRKLIANGHEIVIIRTEKEIYFSKPTHDFGLEFSSWQDVAKVKTLADKADALIYQIGDNYEFHHGCLEWLTQLPGIVCLHDFFLGHLFREWAEHNREKANAALRAWCKAEAPNQLFRHHNSETLIAETSETMPMTEWLCAMAQGLITHSSWGIERVLKSCPGPVQVVSLAYEAPTSLPMENRSTKDKLHILTIGNVNKNKRIESIITAIAKNRTLRKKSIYRLVGEISSKDRSKLSSLAKKHKVNLIISGQVEDAVLVNAIEQADVITCLRYPALEAASASAIEALLCGKLIIVTDNGFYREIPDSCAIKINPENEISEIQSIFMQYLDDPDPLYAIAKKGQEWARATFTADNYAQKLIEMAESTTRTKALINAINYFNKLLHGWGAQGELGKNYIIEPLSVFEGIS